MWGAADVQGKKLSIAQYGRALSANRSLAMHIGLLSITLHALYVLGNSASAEWFQDWTKLIARGEEHQAALANQRTLALGE